MKENHNWKRCGYIAIKSSTNILKIMFQDPLTSKKFYLVCDLDDALDVVTCKRGNVAIFTSRHR
ncbi:hypothetical protein ES705_35594 [subsurface metagenome]